jgi:hypothetical protein
VLVNARSYRMAPPPSTELRRADDPRRGVRLPVGRLRAAVCACAVAAAALSQPDLLTAQQVVRLAGRGDAAVDRRLTRLLALPDLTVVLSDTVIGVADTVPGSVLVLDARLTLEGHVAGHLVGVRSDLFLRPTATTGHDVVNLAGGLYRSELAVIGGATLDLPLARYRIEHAPASILIVGESDRSRLALDGVFGLRVPTYDRVSGLRLAWGASYLLSDPAARGGPRLHGQIGYATHRGDLEGGLDLHLPAGRTLLELGVHRTTRTNEEWIRSDLLNSLHYLWRVTDFRDYYDARILYAQASRQLDAGRFRLRPALRLEVEEAASLTAGSPWSIWGRRRDPRPNPPVDEIRLASATASLAADWRGSFATASVLAELEAAGHALGGERAFGRGRLYGTTALDALGDHRLDVEWHAGLPLWGALLPPQRWSYVGGFGNLQTMPLGLHRGEYQVYLASTYWIPLPAVGRLPLLGAPELGLIHGVGGAWNRDDPDRSLTQNVGAQLRMSFLLLRYMIDPSTRADDFDFTLVLPTGPIR